MRLKLLTVFFLTMLAGLGSGAAATAAAPANPKPVLVYYLPWYAARPFSPDWGWHWTMGHFEPDRLNASGDREVASWYYPLIGPYDSADPVVLEYHVLLMKLAGIDGIIVDWYGSTEFYDYAAVNRNSTRLFEIARRAGLQLAICYEDQTIQHLIDGGQITAAGALRHAQEEMLFLETNFFCNPSYFRIGGRPLLENFGPQYFLASTSWDEIFSVLAPSNRPAFFTEDNRLEAGCGAFDWPPMWLSRQPGTGEVLSEAALKNYLAGFEKKSADWPAFVSSAFPRFHDIYQRAGVRNYWGYLGDRHGQTLRETFGRAMTNNSALVQVVTWNDFGEGTMIEPTKEYGFRDLKLIQDFCRPHRDALPAAVADDLPLALRFYQLRRRAGTDAALNAVLDRVFAALVSGDESGAAAQLTQLETRYPQRASSQ